MTVASDKGIGWTALSTVSVRDIVGTAVLTALHTAKVEVTAEGEGRVHYMPIEQSKIPAEVREIVLTAVRYAPDLERFRRERAS